MHTRCHPGDRSLYAKQVIISDQTCLSVLISNESSLRNRALERDQLTSHDRSRRGCEGLVKVYQHQSRRPDNITVKTMAPITLRHLGNYRLRCCQHVLNYILPGPKQPSIYLHLDMPPNPSQPLDLPPHKRPIPKTRRRLNLDKPMNPIQRRPLHRSLNPRRQAKDVRSLTPPAHHQPARALTPKIRTRKTNM